MKITVLGCGSSGGVPLIGNDWGDCDPNDPRNRRSRVSVLVEQGDTKLLVDTSPDMRQQLLNCNLQDLTGVIYTHAHADHCHGIDDLRTVNWMIKRPIDIYADPATMNELRERFGYILGHTSTDTFHKPSVIQHVIEGEFEIDAIRIVPIKQNHGHGTSYGFRFNDFAYSTDVKELDDAAFEALKGIKVWIVDCVRETEHHTHSHLAQTLKWIERVKPDRAYLTHMNQTLDYVKLSEKLPKGVWPGHDGLVIEC